MMLLNHVSVESLVAGEGVIHSLFMTYRTAMKRRSLLKLLSTRTVVHTIVWIFIGFQLSLIKCQECRASR
eukprot:8676669-Heterocapsa_arctica.AAC.1